MRRRSWAAVTAGGVVALVAGLFFIFFPVAALTTLVFLFGAFALLAGVVALIGGFTNLFKKEKGAALLLAEGLLAIAAGIIVFAWPAITATIFLWVIATWAVVVGIVEMVQAFRARNVDNGAWLLAAAGAFTLVFGIALFIVPTSSVLAISWLLGVYLIARGFVQIGYGASLRRPLARQAV